MSNFFGSLNKSETVFEALPNTFQRKEAVALATNFDIKERTVDNFLKAYLNKYLTKVDTGFYKKIEK